MNPRYCKTDVPAFSSCAGVQGFLHFIPSLDIEPAFGVVSQPYFRLRAGASSVGPTTGGPAEL